MKIRIITVGKKNDSSLDESINDFTQRISKFSHIEWLVIPSSDIAKESKEIAKHLDAKDVIVVLDEKGKEIETKDLAGFIQKQLNSSVHRLVIIIGGAFGVSDELKASAQYVLSLSKLTLPHQLVRLLIVEQIYRAFSILNNGKYHHE